MNTKQQRFVTEYLKWGIPALAYANAYNKPNPNGRAIESAANRLMRNPAIKQAIHDAEDRIRHQVEQEIADREALDVFTIEQKRHLLKQIATGNMLVEQRYKGSDCRQCTQLVRPTINQMLRAIDLDNRMSAHYPPPQQKMKIPPYKEVPFEQRVEDVHSRGTDNPTPEQQQPNAVSSLPQLKKTSMRQQNTTSDTDNKISLPPSEWLGRAGFRGIGGQPAQDPPAEQQKTTADNTCPPLPVPTVSGAGGSSSDRGGSLAVGTREEHATKCNNPAETETPTITHDELMELLYPKEEKLQQQTTFHNNSA